MKNKTTENLIFILTAISFTFTLNGFITEYIEIINMDYSYLKATWEIFKIAWWRVPIMIFNILVAFA